MPEAGDKIYGTSKIRCVRTSCITKRESIVNLKYYAKYGLYSHWWFYLVGGPTGYESLDMESKYFKPDKGWTACMGTKNRWDKLFVPGAELASAIADLLMQIM